jgi:hypothetical protein
MLSLCLAPGAVSADNQAVDACYRQVLEQNVEARVMFRGIA